MTDKEITPELIEEIRQKTWDETPEDEKQFFEARWQAALKII
jgi:hypothetical protein